MKINIWPKLNEIHQRWLTNEASIDLIKADLLGIIEPDNDVVINRNNTEKVNGTSYYSVQRNRQKYINSLKTSDNCVSPRPLTPSKSPRSPRKNLSMDYKKEINQNKSPNNSYSNSDDSSTKKPQNHIIFFHKSSPEPEPISNSKNLLPNTKESIIRDKDKPNQKKTNSAYQQRGQPATTNQNKSSTVDVPRFYYSKGKPAYTFKEVEIVLVGYRDKLSKIALSDKTIPFSKLGEIINIVNIPYYWKYPFYLCCNGHGDEPLRLDDVISTLKVMLTNCGTDAAKFMFIMTKGGLRNFLERSDFEPLLKDVLETHPGLQFLKSSIDFHSHYMNTVISRIFFNLDTNWDDKLTLQEISRSDLIWVLNYLEKHDDINTITQYFSYEHFYVIYCKFWELDNDHDLVISQEDLARHNNYSLSDRVIDRIFEGTVMRKPSDDKTMLYSEFVWFLLAEEDKQHPRSIEYWFRVMDLDGDGVLSLYELEYFYSEQLARMEERGIEPLSFNDCLCMMLDMVQAKSCSELENPTQSPGIYLSDLKSCKQASIFFNTFINLYKYLEHEQSDPFNNLRDIEEGLADMSDWDRFAAETYEQLVLEDQQQMMASSNEYDYEDDFESDDNSPSMPTSQSASSKFDKYGPKDSNISDSPDNASKFNRFGLSINKN